MWKDILKRLKTQSKTLTGFEFEDIEEERPEVELEDTDCYNQLKAYADKIKNLPDVLKGEEIDDGHHWDVNTYPTLNSREEVIYTHERNNAHEIMIDRTWTLEIISEKIACLALEMFKKSIQTNQPLSKNIDGFVIITYSNSNGIGIHISSNNKWDVFIDTNISFSRDSEYKDEWAIDNPKIKWW